MEQRSNHSDSLHSTVKCRQCTNVKTASKGETNINLQFVLGCFKKHMWLVKVAQYITVKEIVSYSLNNR